MDFAIQACRMDNFSAGGLCLPGRQLGDSAPGTSRFLVASAPQILARGLRPPDRSPTKEAALPWTSQTKKTCFFINPQEMRLEKLMPVVSAMPKSHKRELKIEAVSETRFGTYFLTKLGVRGIPQCVPEL